MKRLVVFLIITFFSFQSFSQFDDQSVLYGEHSKRVPTSEDHLLRIFVDRNGDFYPENLISNEELKAAGSSLSTWSSQNEMKFAAICASYAIPYEHYSKDKFEELQDSIANRLLRSVNVNAETSNSVTVLIHGFRKPFETRLREGDSWSFNGYESIRTIVNKHVDSTFFVEVYWDGGYDCCVSRNLKKNKPIFRLFEVYARNNAAKTGYSLRKVVSRFAFDTINVISHSTGAIVSSTLLFNSFTEMVNDQLKAQPTPSQTTVNHCLLAAAISSEPFNYYFDRNTSVDFRQHDNYSVTVLYNEKDFALMKKDPYMRMFGPGPRRFGATTLGCNHRKEIRKLETVFSRDYPASPIITYKVNPVANHKFTYYASSKWFGKWLDSVN